MRRSGARRRTRRKWKEWWCAGGTMAHRTRSTTANEFMPVCHLTNANESENMMQKEREANSRIVEENRNHSHGLHRTIQMDQFIKEHGHIRSECTHTITHTHIQNQTRITAQNSSNSNSRSKKKFNKTYIAAHMTFSDRDKSLSAAGLLLTLSFIWTSARA